MLTLACLLPVTATAQVNYAVSGGAAYVTYSPNAAGNTVIASTYNGFPVTSIGSDAFTFCTSLTSVTIPDGVTSIPEYAFYSCTNLTNLTFLGNAPELWDDFYHLGAGATVYYYYGTDGWETTFGGLPAVMLGAPAPQVGTGSGRETGRFRLHPQRRPQSNHRGRGQHQPDELAIHLDQYAVHRLHQFC